MFPAEVAVPSNAHPQSMEQKQERHQRQLRRRQRFRRASCLPDKTNHHQKDSENMPMCAGHYMA